ncbi:glycosyltransferase [Steroidobacter agaridevorans]|uniref:glycosyltransferase n=1 Tax=Steroidobacter agaridevorans TaxID=2695856 RepID=UPI00132BBA53|nr:glycosyltransferase [Steroidobacter agaridevorans]GFE87062.1 glycosyl transferase [Steroidobacter agaridevorans]
MRIAHLITSLDPAQGGPPAVATRLASAQASHAAAVTLLASHPQARFDDVRKSLAQVRGMDRVAVAFTSPGRDAISVLRESNIDVLHVHGLWQPQLLFALRWADRNGLPFVITPHGMLSAFSLSQKPVRKRLALALGWRKLLGRASYLHVLNDIEAADLGKVTAPVRLAVLPNGIDTAEFQTQLGEEPIRELTAGRRYVLFLARLHHIKAPDLAVDAFATVAQAFPDVDLIVAGPDGGERDNVFERVARLGLGARVKVVGAIYGAAKVALLQNAICVIQPSRHEAQSITLLEALAAGAPLIVTPECNFPEAQAAGAAIVAPGVPDRLGEAMRAMLSDAQMRAASAERGRALVAEKYQWSHIGRRFVDLYRSCVPARSASFTAA